MPTISAQPAEEGPAPNAEKIAARAKTCARLFLDGCLVNRP